MEFLTFHVGEREFAVALERVREIVNPPPITRVPGMPPALLGLVGLRGDPAAVVDAGLRLAGRPIVRSARSPLLLLTAQLADRPAEVGLLVEAAGRKLELDALMPWTEGLARFAGSDACTGFADVEGAIVLVLDVDQLFAFDRVVAASSRALPARPPPPEGALPATPPPAGSAGTGASPTPPAATVSGGRRDGGRGEVPVAPAPGVGLQEPDGSTGSATGRAAASPPAGERAVPPPSAARILRGGPPASPQRSPAAVGPAPGAVPPPPHGAHAAPAAPFGAPRFPTSFTSGAPSHTSPEPSSAPVSEGGAVGGWGRFTEHPHPKPPPTAPPLPGALPAAPRPAAGEARSVGRETTGELDDLAALRERERAAKRRFAWLAAAALAVALLAALLFTSSDGRGGAEAGRAERDRAAGARASPERSAEPTRTHFVPSEPPRPSREPEPSAPSIPAPAAAAPVPAAATSAPAPAPSSPVPAPSAPAAAPAIATKPAPDASRAGPQDPLRPPSPRARRPLPPAMVVTPGTPPCEIHEVKKGESLWLISARRLGSPYRWPTIYGENRDHIADPNVIEIDDRIRVPGACTPRAR